MATYVFKHLDGTESGEIYASTEMFARAGAMEKKWGPPKSLIHPEPGTKNYLVIGEPIYNGYGLDLISVKK